MQIGFVAWAFLTVAWAFRPDLALEMWTRMAQTLILSLLTWEFAVADAQQFWILRSLLIGLLVPLWMLYGSRFGFYHLDASANPEAVRYTGGGHDQNYMAMMLDIGIVLAAYFATNSSKLDRRLRLFYWTFAGLAAIAVVLTGSRSGSICLVLAAVFVLFVAGLSRRNLVYSLSLLGFLVFVAMMIYYVVPAALQQRVTEVNTESGTLVERWSFGSAA